MASAYSGILLFPPVTGWIATQVSLSILMPIVIALILAMAFCTEIMNRIFFRRRPR